MLLRLIFNAKCPSCHKGDVFAQSSFSLIRMPKMHQNCAQCGHKFEKEPGYFFGAMYVSYGLVLAELAISFLLFWLLSIPEDYLFLVLFLPIILLWPLNFRLSRMIWMYAALRM